MREGADAIATGHYVRKSERHSGASSFASFRRPASGFTALRPRSSGFAGHHARSASNAAEEDSARLPFVELLQAKDLNKDQSYFLYSLTQEQLAYALFPIGEYTKPEVRAMAREWGLPTANRKDSQGLCFLGKIPVRDFLKTRLAPREGALVTVGGDVVGTHEGAHYLTIGQRHGIGSRGGGTPYFVVEKDVAANTVIVARGKEDQALYRSEARLKNVRWIAGIAPDFPFACFARIRYRQPLQEATIDFSPLCKGEREGVIVHFTNPQRAVTPGQACVLYGRESFDGAEGRYMLGGGVIA